MKIYNTLKREKEEFVPINPPHVGIYACGVTVYDYCHIGHARSAIVFDVIRNYLIYKKYSVKFVRNFTDIDDKIIKKAKEENIPWDEVARKYTEEYYKDMELLGVKRADIEPKATDHIKEMIEIVEALIEKGFAYEVDGNVYFSVEKFPEYGKLSKRDLKEMLAGARVEVDENKRNPLDFALWKKSKEGEPYWESPWGKGRPGWHIECTAMSIKHLGESFDIHGGGADLMFPHHENEIAQSEAYTGKTFAKYWVHNGFITINKEKMSKSLGNFFTIREVLKEFDPEVVRVFLLSTHYRSPIEFSDEQLKETESSVDRFYSTIQRIDDYLELLSGIKKGNPFLDEDFLNFLKGFGKKFEEAMDDDFNTALAIGHIFEFVKEINKYIDRKPSGNKCKELLIEAKSLLSKTSDVLNIFNRSPRQWYVSLLNIKKIGLTEDEIVSKIELRQQARKNKRWDVADSIRNELEDKGIILEDKRYRTDWKVKVR